MSVILDAERLQARAGNLGARNGFSMGYLTLDPADPPAFAWLEVEFHNANGLSSPPAATAFAIEGGVRRGLPPVAVTEVHAVPASTNTLRLKIAPVGDYSTYTLTTSAGAPVWLDPLLSRLPFKFRPGCFNLSCAPESGTPRRHERPAIDYLARDYDSFRHVLMAAMASRVPGWKPTSEVDLDQVIIDLIAARADELADAHDRVMAERALGTARKRVSLARHARLVDYHIDQGNQATTQVVVDVLAQTDLPPAVTPAQWGWSVFSRPNWNDPDAAIFALVERPGAWRRRVFPELNVLNLYTWGDTVTALAKGATSADLHSGAATSKASAERLRDLFLGVDGAQTGAPIDVDPAVDRLVLQEVLNPETGTPNGASRDRRKLLRLVPLGGPQPRAEALRDPVTGSWFCRVRWVEAHQLDQNYCFLTQCPGGLVRDVSQFFGNVVDVAHGRPRQVTFRPPGAPLLAPNHGGPFALDEAHWAPIRRQRGGAMQLAGTEAALPQDGFGPLAYRQTEPDGEAEPRSTLAVSVGGIARHWEERIDLIDSNGQHEHFAVETDELQRSLLRFGDGTNGRPLRDDAVVTCRFQCGHPGAGNIGADTLRSSLPAAVQRANNPFDVTTGRFPEPREQVLRRAPEKYRARQRRAVTLDDYAREAERVYGVAHARARYAWCGSWRVVQVVIDPTGGGDVAPALRDRVASALDAVRLIGDDFEILPAAYVPADIKLVLCAHPSYWIEDLRPVLEREFSDGYTADGRPGFFHPDLWTFGQELHSSQLVGRALSVQGIERAVRVSMRRFNPGGGGLVTVTLAPEDVPEMLREKLPVGPFEILVVASDPDHLERGRIAFEIGGGRR